MTRNIVLAVFLFICVLLLAPYIGFGGSAQHTDSASEGSAPEQSAAPAQDTPSKSLDAVEHMLK